MKTAAKSAKSSRPAPPPATQPAALFAKVFKSGNSQAVRIPSSVKLKAKTYRIEADHGGSLVLIDVAHEARRLKALRELRGSAPDFPDHST